MVTHQVVDGAGELDDVIDPAALFRAQFGDGAFVREGLAGKIVVPGMAVVEVVLKKIDMGQHVIEDHHVEPVGIVVVVKGDRRAGVDHRLVGVGRVQFIFALFAQHLHVVDPVVVKGRDHDLGREFQKIPVGDDILQGFVAEAQAGVPGPFLAALHDPLGMLVDEFHLQGFKVHGSGFKVEKPIDYFFGFQWTNDRADDRNADDRSGFQVLTCTAGSRPLGSGHGRRGLGFDPAADQAPDPLDQARFVGLLGHDVQPQQVGPALEQSAGGEVPLHRGAPRFARMLGDGDPHPAGVGQHRFDGRQGVGPLGVPVVSVRAVKDVDVVVGRQVFGGHDLR